MRKTKIVHLSVLFLSIILISIAMLYVNRFCFRFPGVLYFSPSLLSAFFSILLIYFGLTYQFDLNYDRTVLKSMRMILIYMGVMLVVLLSTTAIQYTPFPPIDKKILWVEHYLHLDLQASIDWLGEKKALHDFAHFFYMSLTYQVILLPLWVLIMGDYNRLYHFYFLTLSSWLIGSSLYYLIPTAAPASLIESPYFIVEQYMTGLKFWQLHHYIQPTSSDGGMISLPSFHVIWAWLCVYLVRPWPLLCGVICVSNLIIVCACVLLGWHYFLDVVASVGIIFMAHFLLNLSNKKCALINN